MKLRREFREHLLWVYNCIGRVLADDECGKEFNGYNLYPALYQLLSYMWRMMDIKSFLKK